MINRPWFAPAWAQFLQRLDQQRLAHALLIVAEPGSDVTAFAAAAAARLMCGQPAADGQACGKCSDCHLRAAGSHPDFFAIGLLPTAKGDPSKVIKIDQIRELSARMALTAQRARRKVALIEPADQLNIEAANALLKTLEEPPAESFLLLATEYPKRLPQTILSRCQRLSIGRLPDADLAAWLRVQKPLSDEDIALALALAPGPAAALEFIDSGELKAARKLLETLVEIASESRSAIGFGAELVQANAEKTLAWVQLYLKLALALRLGVATGLTSSLTLRLQQLAQRHSARSLNLLLEQLQRIILGIKAPLKHDLIIDAWATQFASTGLTRVGS